MLRRHLLVAVSAIVTVGLPVAVAAPVAPAISVVSPAWAATDFATGFANQDRIGPLAVAVGPTGRVYVADLIDGGVYVFGPGGGVASDQTRLGTTTLSNPVDLAFTPDGHLYASQEQPASIVELNPTTGAVIRTIPTGGQYADGLAVDPVTGDLFVDEYTVPGDIDRISGLNTDAPTVQRGWMHGLDYPDGMQFAPNGTLFVSEEGGDEVAAITGVNTAQPTRTTLTTIPGTGPDGIMLGHGFLLVNQNNGTIMQISLDASHTYHPVFNNGTRGDIAAVGGDGCGYATQTDRVIRITNADGSCTLVPDVRFNGPVGVLRSVGKVTPHTAVLRGTLNPLGAATHAAFAWGRTPSFGGATTVQSFPADSAAHNISAKLSGLHKNRQYFFELVTQSTAGRTSSTLGTFHTGS